MRITKTIFALMFHTPAGNYLTILADDEESTIAGAISKNTGDSITHANLARLREGSPVAIGNGLWLTLGSEDVDIQVNLADYAPNTYANEAFTALRSDGYAIAAWQPDEVPDDGDINHLENLLVDRGTEYIKSLGTSDYEYRRGSK